MRSPFGRNTSEEQFRTEVLSTPPDLLKDRSVRYGFVNNTVTRLSAWTLLAYAITKELESHGERLPKSRTVDHLNNAGFYTEVAILADVNRSVIVRVWAGSIRRDLQEGKGGLGVEKRNAAAKYGLMTDKYLPHQAKRQMRAALSSALRA